jgi:YfiH family protein
MILPPGVAGAAFSEVVDGDIRHDDSAHARLSERLGVPDRWATVRQVHGATVRLAVAPGVQGDADAMWTEDTGLPLAVYTADCFGIVMRSDRAVGVAHAGWRGAAAGVVRALRESMTDAGHAPTRAVMGPGIRSCCFEVGEEVAALFPGHVTRTTWGTLSVDLPAVLLAQLDGLEAEVIEGCTAHQDRFFSHRRAGLPHRMVALGWR